MALDRDHIYIYVYLDPPFGCEISAPGSVFGA